MKPALIAALLTDEYYTRPAPKNEYYQFLRTIANGRGRNTNVVKGYRLALKQLGA